jgi:hypothetical protein
MSILQNINHYNFWAGVLNCSVEYERPGRFAIPETAGEYKGGGPSYAALHVETAAIRA